LTLRSARQLQRIRVASSEPPAPKRYKGGVGVGGSSSLLADAAQGAAALRSITHSTWWEWNLGSTLLFWRWGTALPRQHDRDDIPICVMGELPKAPSQQRAPSHIKAPLMASKLDKVLERDYIRKGKFQVYIDYCDVPKGAEDIRVVYHGTKSGINAQLWAPQFHMPTGTTAVNFMAFNTWLTDSDIGEVFPNFPMDPMIRSRAGVDLKALVNGLKNYSAPTNEDEEYRWERLFMRMGPSPYIALRMYYVAEEFFRGPPLLPNNPMGYDKVRLNLPGADDYTPTLPRVIKWNRKSASIAGDVVTFVGDLRASGHSVENYWQVSRQLSARMQ
jgi:hypothetical protein